jgi:mitochondrial chaperone BCS1
MENLQSLVLQLQKIYQENVLLLGALSIYVLGFLTYVFRTVPKKLFNFLKHQFVVSLVVENDGWYNQELYSAFLKWTHGKLSHRFSRSLNIQKTGNATVVGPGYGTHILFFKNRPVWFTIEQIDSSGSDKQKKRISVSTLGRKLNILNEIADSIVYIDKEDQIKHSYSYSQNEGWEQEQAIVPRNFNSLMLEDDIKTLLFSEIDKFHSSKDWYLEKGISYKLGIFLYGKPGTGKSSIVRALATKYNKNIYQINLGRISDERLKKAFNSVKPDSLILFEDVDNASVTKSRENKEDSEFTSLSFSGLLNILDGINSTQGVITIFTTNYFDKIDAALLRPGRSDLKLNIKTPSSQEIKRYLEFMYNTEISFDIETKKSPAEIENLVKQNKHDLKNLLTQLNKQTI